MEKKYYYGNPISEYGLENGYVDYATLSKCFDAVLNNDIMSLTYDIGPAVRMVTLYNRHELINNRVMERLYNCLRNGIYVTCNMYDEFKSLEEKKYNCESYTINSDIKEWY